MAVALALRALHLVKLLRQPKGKVLVHSEQSSQYTSRQRRDYAEDNGRELSQSRRENCWDNVIMEHFFGSLKSEWVKKRRYADVESAKQAISKYVIEYYNMWRSHSHLGSLSPNEYEIAT